MRFLLKLDALAQRAVDAPVFFLMRRFGWRKSFIRYAAYALGIVSVAGLGLIFWSWRTGNARAAWAMAGYALFVFMFIASQHLDHRQDLESEAGSGAASQSDRPHPADGFLKVLLALNAPYTAKEYFWIPPEWLKAGMPNSVCHAATTLLEIFFLTYLFLLYLKRTPSNPPPSEERVPAALETSRT